MNRSSLNSKERNKQSVIHHLPDIKPVLQSLMACLFFCIAPPLNSNAQDNETDSILLLLQNEKKSSVRSGLLEKLFSKPGTLSYEDALQYGNEALVLYQQEKDFYQLGVMYGKIASLARRHNHYEVCARYADSAMLTGNRIKNNELLAHGHFQKGFYYESIDERENAIHSFLKVFDYTKSKILPHIESLSAIRLSGIFSTNLDRQMAKKYALLATEKALLAKREDLEAIAANLLAVSYTDEYREDTARKQYLDTATGIYNNLLKKYAAGHNTRPEFATVINMSYVNLLEIYVSLLPPKNPAEINRLFTDAANLFQFFPVAKTSSYSTYCAMKGKWLLQQNQLREAEQILNEGISFFKESSVNDPYQTAEFEQVFAMLYEKRKDYKQSLEHYKAYLSSSLDYSSAQRLSTMKGIESTYKERLTQQKIKELELLAANRKTIIYFSTGIAFLCLILFFFIWRSFRHRKKMLTEKAKVLEQEKNEAELVSRLTAEKAARNELEKNEALLKAALQDEEMMRLLAEKQLTLQQKEQLQRELLANSLHNEKKTALLKELQTHLSSTELSGSIHTKDIGKIVKKGMKLDEDFAKVNNDIRQIHPAFFAKLQEQAGQTLTMLDLKYCTYMYLQMSTKEIAGLLHVDPNTIRVTRYRIKQKLKLSKEEDLDQYLLAIA